MTNILLTGATGFIGGHLAEALVQRGAAVRCLIRPNSQSPILESLDVELVRGDLSDASVVLRALRGIDTLYHVAGAVSERTRGEMLRVNGHLTGEFAKTCASVLNPPTFILVSSVAAAGPTRRGKVRQPSDPPNPISQYGRSKWEGENRIAALAGQMPVTVIRPGAVFGERDRATLSIFQTIGNWRIHPVLGFRTPPLSVIHVADLVEILIRAADHGQRLSADPIEQSAGRGFYFACLDQYPTYAQLGGMVRRAMDCPFAPVFYLARPLGWTIAFGNELLSRFGWGVPLLSLDKLREAGVASWACSPAETFRDLDFTPTVPFEVRLRQTAAWYRQAGWL